MKTKDKMSLVVVDLSVRKTSPAGSCVLSELLGLVEVYNIHLFSAEVDDRIKNQVVYHQIKTPSAPLVLRYVVFSNRVKTEMKKLLNEIEGPYIIQTTQGQYIDSTISYPHFCHRAYLNKHWKNSTISGIRRGLRKLNHLYNAKMEALAFSKAKVIVVPSKGLAKELVETYPPCSAKVQVIANPVDVEYFNKPGSFNIAEQREKIGIGSNEIVIAFAALGDFARKGLPELMRSLKEKEIRNAPFKILVIGGKPKEIANYKQQAEDLDVAEKVVFVGFKKDIRPFLWMSNIFALPSLYEIFPLVCIQAAAAGLPLLASQMHGVEEYLIDGKNGWLVERNPQSIAGILKGVVEEKFDLSEMGSIALESVRQYDHESFREKWKQVYKTLEQSNKF